MHRPETLFRLHSLAWTVLGLALATGCSTGTGTLGRWPQTLKSAATAPHTPMADVEIACTVELPVSQTRHNIDPWARWNGEEDPNVTRAFAELEYSTSFQRSQPTKSWLAQANNVAGSTPQALTNAANPPINDHSIQRVDHENFPSAATGIANSALPSTIETAGNWSTPKSIATLSR